MKAKVIDQLTAAKVGNGNLYDHLCKVMTELTLNQQSLDNLQAISFNQRSKTSNQIVYRVRQSYSDLKDYESKNRQLLGKVNIGSAQQPQQPASFCYIPDSMEEARVFQKFGVGLGEDLTYLVFKSLARMSQKKNAKHVRFWGKILGSEKDYYIAQGQADAGEDPGQLSPDTQPKGTGANKSTFWATTNLSGQWTQLPVITPTQIQIARRIKYIFTGDLNRNILTNPLFPGKQAHLLKCQLVRISTTCTIIPKGMFNVNAQNPREIQAPQQYKYPEIGYLAKIQNWVYHQQSLLNNGRISWIKPEGIEGDDEIIWNKKMTSTDPMQPRLKSIALDSNNWALKTIGLQDTYKTIGRNPKTVSKGVVGIKNTIWPGWVAIAYGDKYSYMYMGYGHKAKQFYYPAEPQQILQQCEDKQQVIIQQ